MLVQKSPKVGRNYENISEDMCVCVVSTTQCTREKER